MSEDIFGDDGLKRFDFGLGLKAGVEFSKKYQVAISYDFGLVEVIKRSRNEEQKPDDLVGIYVLKPVLQLCCINHLLPLHQLNDESYGTL